MMKKKCLGIILTVAASLLLCISTAYAEDEIEINSTNFPDSNFQSYLKEYHDKDKSGGLSTAEINATTSMDCSEEEIENLSGIEFFTELEKLDCSENEISKLSLTNNTKLKTLNCDDNEISSLSLTNNTALTSLDCSSNSLTSLNITKNTALTYLSCSSNYLLKSLDLSGNTALQQLYCSNCKFESLDISNNTALTYLNCTGTCLTSLDASNNQLIKSFSVSGTYTVTANADRTFDMSKLPGSFKYNQRSDVTGGTAEGYVVKFNKDSNTITYKYDCKHGYEATFTLKASNLHACKFGEWVSNGDGTHTRTCTVEGCTESETEKSTGSGTEKDPYTISSAAELDAVRNNMSACYQLIADIVFTEADFAKGGTYYNDGEGWLPLGAAQTSSGTGTPFKGTFDGNGHVIKGLYINRPSERDTGLFKYLNGTIKSLGMEEGQIIGDQRVGSIVGGIYTYTYNAKGQQTGQSLVQNCYNTCSVTATGGFAGGIAGEGRATIDSCYNSGTIKSLDYGYAGGIVPIMQSGTISNCYNCGDIISIGGYAAGGIYGQSYSATTSNCYSVGNTCTEYSFDGYSTGNGTIWDGTKASAVSKTIAELKNKETFTGFDFDSVWSLSSSSKYPYPILKTVANASRQNSLTIKKHNKPATPAISKCTTKTIVVESTSGYYYSCETSSSLPAEGSTSWKQAGGNTITFTGLQNGKNYYIFAYNPNADDEYYFCVSTRKGTSTKLLGNVIGSKAEVNASDCLYLRKYLAKWDGYAVDTSAESTADINEDGVVDAEDLIILERHVASWEGYETLPVDESKLPA